MTKLDDLDHVAIEVTNIAESVSWYSTTFKCTITYQDDTWAYLQFNNVKLALVVKEQHPSHLAFALPEAEKFGQLKPHRDGTRSCYIKDPSGNPVEIMAVD